MKRLTQMLASILFIITVLTVYLAFDFVITNTVPKKYSTDKHDDYTFKTTSSILSLLKSQTLKSNNDQDRRTRSIKSKQHPGKPAQFHKSKTGIKINQMKKPSKDSRKRSSIMNIPQQKDIKSKTHN